MSDHLWEHDHDYYGPKGSYWANGYQQAPYNNRFESWSEFIEEGGMSDADKSMNMLYRWDWHDYRKDIEDAKAGGWYAAEDYPHDFELALFWMMPRKGIMARSNITVTPEDEPAVRAWLEPHAAYMRDLWAPLMPVPSSNQSEENR